MSENKKRNPAIINKKCWQYLNNILIFSGQKGNLIFDSREKKFWLRENNPPSQVKWSLSWYAVRVFLLIFPCDNLCYPVIQLSCTNVCYGMKFFF
jgi:hypothetical protein